MDNLLWKGATAVVILIAVLGALAAIISLAVCISRLRTMKDQTASPDARANDRRHAWESLGIALIAGSASAASLYVLFS